MAVAVELGVVLVIALADNEHDMLAAKGACIHCHVLYSGNELVNLLSRQFVGIYTEGKAIYGEIEVGTVFLGEFMLHVTDILVRHKSHSGNLVIDGLSVAVI